MRSEDLKVMKNIRVPRPYPRNASPFHQLGARGGSPLSLSAGGYPQPIGGMFERATMSQTTSLGLSYACLWAEEAGFLVFTESFPWLRSTSRGNEEAVGLE